MAGKLKKVILALICAALIITAALLSIRAAFPAPYRDAVENYASEYGLDRSLVYAVIKAESNFDPTAVSHAGAKGLAQLTDATARYVAEMAGVEYEDGDSFDAEINIRLAACYLRYLSDKYEEDYVCVMAAYNAGEGNVDRWLASGESLASIPFRETERYLRRVRLYKRVYEVMYGM